MTATRVPSSLLGRLGRNSAVYTIANVVQRGIPVILLPIYTHRLAPADFGILSVITALNSMAALFFTLSLHGAIARYYFVLREQPREWREFLGSILLAVLFLSLGLGALLLLVGGWLLAPVLGAAKFWPYAALGIVATAFQPFFLIYQSLLQTREMAGRYALVGLVNSAMSIGLIIWFVNGWGMKAEGPLLASAIVAVVFFIVTLYLVRAEADFVLRWRHLKRALQYSLPLVPHTVAGQVQVIFDRFAINGLLGVRAVGIYQVAYLFGGLISVVSDAANRAYVPVAMSALTDGGETRHAELRNLGLLLICLFCLLAACLGLFSPELVWLLTSASYRQAALLVPLIAYGFAAAGIYYVFVNVLFYEGRGTKFVMIGTICGAAANVTGNMMLIPKFGATGAAVAGLAAQVLVAAITGGIGFRFERIKWPYWRIATCFLACLAATDLSAPLTAPPSWPGILIKLVVLACEYVVCNLLLWGVPNHLGQRMMARAIAHQHADATGNPSR